MKSEFIVRVSSCDFVDRQKNRTLLFPNFKASYLKKETIPAEIRKKRSKSIRKIPVQIGKMAEAVGLPTPSGQCGRKLQSVRLKRIGERMKIVTKFFLSLCLVAGLGATVTTKAQIQSNVTIKANVPYSFVVNNTTLPAGTYTINVLDAYSSDLTVLEIRSANAKTAVLFDTDTITVPGLARRTELVFDRIGDAYFLSKVFLEGGGGNELPKSKMQRRLEENGSIAERHSVPASPAQANFAKRAVR